MPVATARETFWHVVEIQDSQDSQDSPRSHSFTVGNDTPHRLHWVAEPHLGTHRIIAIQHRRARSGPSCVRLVLESLGEPKRQISLHTQLISLTVPR